MLSDKGSFRNAFVPIAMVYLYLPWNPYGPVWLCVFADLHLLAAGLCLEACAKSVVAMIERIIESAALFFQSVNFMRKLLFVIILV